MPLIEIDDADDPRLADYREVQDRDRRGPDGRPGLFVVEAALPVERMLSIPGLTKSVLMTPQWVERLAALAPDDVPLFVAPRSLVKTIAGFDIHRGVLAVGFRPPESERTIDRAVPSRPGPLTVLLCEEISNIDNIGMLFRNAAAFAVDAVILSPRCHDPLYRKSVRVSIGTVLDTPWARCVDWIGDLRRLKAEWGLTLIGTSLGARSEPLDAIPRPQRVGLVVGHEYDGISEPAAAECDQLARIPMAAGVDSLNVGVATAVCLHRFSRGART